MKKTIRLTENDLLRIVKRVIKEDMGGMEDNHPRFGNRNFSEMSKNEVIELISDFFKEEVMPELSPVEQKIIKRKIDSTNNVNLSEDMELPKGLGRRNAGLGEKSMMLGGAGMTLAGLISAVSNSMGWTEFELTTKIHDYIQSAGLGTWAGPISMAMVAAGLAMAFKGRSMKYSRTGR